MSPTPRICHSSWWWELELCLPLWSRCLEKFCVSLWQQCFLLVSPHISGQQEYLAAHSLAAEWTLSSTQALQTSLKNDCNIKFNYETLELKAALALICKFRHLFLIRIILPAFSNYYYYNCLEQSSQVNNFVGESSPSKLFLVPHPLVIAVQHSSHLNLHDHESQWQ